MNSINNLVPFANDELELVIDTNTGEAFASQRAVARMCEVSEMAIRKWIGANQINVIITEIVTAGGMQGANLLDESSIYEALAKYNSELLVACAKAGLRVYLHKLAGYQVSSTAQESKAEIAADSFKCLTSGQLMTIRDALTNPASVSPEQLGILTQGISPAVVAMVGALTNEQYVKLYLALRTARVPQDVQDQIDSGLLTEAQLKIADKTIERFEWLQKGAERKWQQAISSTVNQKTLERAS